MRHLKGRTQGGFSREHGGVDDVYLVIGGGGADQEVKFVLASDETNLDADPVDQETIL